MVNYSTSIDKTNESYLISTHLNTKKNKTYDYGNQGPVLAQAQQGGAVELVNGMQFHLL